MAVLKTFVGSGSITMLSFHGLNLNYNVWICKRGSQYRERCRLSQTVNLFAHQGDRESVLYGESVLCTVVSTKAY